MTLINASECRALISWYQAIGSNLHHKEVQKEYTEEKIQSRIALLANHAAYLDRKPYKINNSNDRVISTFRAHGHCEKCLQQLANCKCHQQVQA